MHEIIALLGPSGCGKSTTLRLVYDWILRDGARQVTALEILGNPEQQDFSVIVSWKGLKVAFYTMGDYSRPLTEAIGFYETRCDVFICACNNGLVRPQKELADRNARIFDKQVAATWDDARDANRNDATRIQGLLLTMIP